MTFRHSVTLTSLTLVLAVAPAATAEISIDRDTVRMQGQLGQTWAPLRPEALTGAVLNPFGDSRGDGAPSIARAPHSDSWEATWALGGATPGLAFARFDEDEQRWTTVRAPAARSGSRSAGRTVSLHHDPHGNAFLLYDDPETGQVLMSSVARDSFNVNPPLVLATPQRPGTSPDAIWDGDELVVAFVGADAGDRLEVMGIVPEWDAAGRIPDGGEGIPGIPEPIFGRGRSALPGGVDLGGTLGGGDSVPGLSGSSDQLDLDVPPPMLRIESLGGDRLLVTWQHEGRICWSQRNAGYWSEPTSAELENPLLFEEVRRRLADVFAGRIDAGAAQEWTRERRVPDGIELRPGRR